MIALSAHLRALRPQLVQRVLTTLAPAARLHQPLKVELIRFYERLAEALETDSVANLTSLMRDWVTSMPALADEGEAENHTLLITLLTLRTETYTTLGAELAADEFPPAIKCLERYFNDMALNLNHMEYQTRLAQAQAKMRRAQERLQQLDKSKSDFIAVAAHELRTPLTLIRGYTSLLQTDLPPETLTAIAPLLSGLNNGVARLYDLIEEMVDVSLIDNDLLALYYEPVELRWLVLEAQAELWAEMGGRDLKWQFEIVDDLPTYADAMRLLRVFSNLLSNAIKFTPDGGTITVTARRLPDLIELRVADTGIGIAPENQERIFEKFSMLGNVTLHTTSKTRFMGGGAGLGLAIARGIVAAHGGTLWVESAGYDEVTCPGTAFHVMLPALTEIPEQPALLSKISALSAALYTQPVAPQS